MLFALFGDTFVQKIHDTYAQRKGDLSFISHIFIFVVIVLLTVCADRKSVV